MLIGKFLIISALVFSQSARVPIGDYPFDYELAGSISSHFQKGDAGLKARFLFERQEGMRGFGHDFKFSVPSNSLFSKKVKCINSFTSYHREVKHLSIQTIDTSYTITDFLSIGHSVAFYELRESQLLAYFNLNSQYINYELRTNLKNTMHKILVAFPISERERTTSASFSPFFSFEYIDTGRGIDWKQRLGVVWNFRGPRRLDVL